jgi:membrane-associated protease RseP (regulator of RpoE activity)
LLRPTILFLVAALALQIVFVGSTLALARGIGARVSGLAVGMPIVLRREIRGLKVGLGLLPLTSYVRFSGMAPGDADRSPGSWRTLRLGARLLLIAGPWAVTLAIAVVCLGGERAVLSLAHAVPQLLVVVDLTPIVRGFIRLLVAEPFPVALGVLMAKATAFNLLPLEVLAGGRILSLVLGAPRGAGTAGEEKASPVWFIISGVLLILWVTGRLVWGLLHAFA